MKVLDYYPESMTKREQFSMCNADRGLQMKTLDGSQISPEVWILYEKPNQDGEDVEILTIKADGEIFSTISPTFIAKFKNIIEFIGKDDIGEIAVFTGQSKAGRTFVSCDLV